MITPSKKIGIVIPYYNASNFIVGVVTKAKQYSEYIVVVNDKSPDILPVATLQEIDGVTILENEKNLGVGGATKAGIAYLLENPEIEVIVKLDADDQMDTNFLPHITSPILDGTCGFTKGNRFRDLTALKKMPTGRRFGNLFLSFLSKVATGYWSCFDFNNGYIGLAAKHARQIDFTAVANNYFFETSLMASLYFQNTTVKEIAMPAIYGDEQSNMKLFKMPFLFSINLLKKFLSRIWKGYFVYDFNIGTLYITFGSLLFSLGVVLGSYYWYYYASRGVLTPLGTIMICTLLIILGFQLLLQAIQFDIINSPKTIKNDD